MAKDEIVITKDNIDELKAALSQAEDRFLVAAGMHIEGEAKEELANSPERIDTGLLRNSITYALSGQHAAITTYHADRTNKGGTRQGFGAYSGSAPGEYEGGKAVYIGSNLDYSVYVHEGWKTEKGKHVAPNRYLKNAVEKNRGPLENKLKEELGNIDI